MRPHSCTSSVLQLLLISLSHSNNPNDNSWSGSSQWSCVMFTGLSHASSSLISNIVKTHSLLYSLSVIKKIIAGLGQQLDRSSCRKILNERAVNLSAELSFKLVCICWQCFSWFWFGCLVLSNCTGELLLSVQLLPPRVQFLFYWCYSNEYWEPLLRTELPDSKTIPFWVNELNLKESCADFV